MVDGSERAVIDPARTGKARFEIDSGADLVEVMARDESGSQGYMACEQRQASLNLIRLR